ncbi:DUF3231 family protein [uncultured Metabacillus sp.]|uniref:DUF3231 family protein n=1 Tax=uncultured Metabacillus sp. TaxID=2860135 RepID=UPI002609BF7A|nr:DUF3231 family protein [uncultured Metabacillus sp.]
MESNNSHIRLTSVEMGKLWATYMGNTASKCVLSYYLQHIDDQDIKKVVENALNLSETLLENIKEIFIKDNFPIPIGFTDKDVNLDAPRLFLDEFYLHYLKYTSKAGMSIYSIAIPIMTREDIREFFINTLNSTIKLITEVDALLMGKGFYIKPPQIPTPEKVDFIRKQNYLNGVFGDIRSLHALEIAHFYDNIENNVTSRGLLTGFSQVASTEKIQKFLLRGKEITNKHIEAFAQQLHKNNLPSYPLFDDLVSTSTSSPFSGKLMLWHKIEMFSMRIRSYANAISLNGRRDIGKMYMQFLMDIELYVEDAANIMIDHGWMEQPPKATDRDELANVDG